ncbi:DNA-directed RNA polymerase subunit beta [candidate division WOR-3 bacterium]|uniref:DNA-directed RNA polymerase subunit beta n=1 Tax=candidate division WOR-3 bacterium TaxID=2052148 RepID=A0A660SIZ9_UNCW3|nr:MAG: DNA-directed RNA polymerase subunit beta [candidate division WOR-3 bacterium]
MKVKDFSKIGTRFEIPHLLEVQLESFREFLEKGITQVFKEAFPVTGLHNRYTLEYHGHEFGMVQYTPEDAAEKGATYSIPLKVKLRLVATEKDALKEAIEQEIYLCDIPLITKRGTFIVNGVERVVVNQLHRSPGLYFSTEKGKPGAMIIPERGQWLEFRVDNQVINAILDRRRRINGFTFLRALGYETDQEIIRLFYEPKSLPVEKAIGHYAAEEIKDEDVTLVEVGDEITSTTVDVLKERKIKEIELIERGSRGLEIVLATLKRDRSTSKEDGIRRIYTTLRSMPPPTPELGESFLHSLLFNPDRFLLGEVGRFKFNLKLKKDQPLTQTRLTPEDIVDTYRGLIDYTEGLIAADDIDHLGNRRVRRVGEMLTNQFRMAILQLVQNIKERASLLEEELLTPQELTNPRLVSILITRFFTTNQLSQFMEQTNPLSELTHKRRLSALGPGGLTRETAGFEVRDVHYTHYGRLCPIETPEGPNIGLISTLANYAKVDRLGFITSPYWKVKGGKVTGEIVYLRADEEDNYTIAQANTPIDSNGRIKAKEALCRRKGDFPIVPAHEVDFMDVSPKQVVSPAASLIPFLEHDDANRALMGSNMQRQAVPLLITEPPLVATGMEKKIAHDSGVLLIAQESGVVESVDAAHIVIRKHDGRRINHELKKFVRSNQNTCINQRPVVRPGDKVKKGTLLADGYATHRGELALGKNVLVAFMPMRGYNFEDAVVISERLVKDDVYTSIHILSFECEVRETKLGPEEITRDIPGLSEERLKNLDEHGIIYVGAEVGPDDILVGKITPKGETELTPEERLLKAIFAEKATNVRDTSLRVDPGVYGVVIGHEILTRKTGDPLAIKIEEERKANAEQRYHLLRDAFLKERNTLLAQLLKGRKVASTIRDEDGIVVFKTGTVLSERSFENLEADLLTAQGKYVEDERLDQKVRKLIGEFQIKLNEIKETYRMELEKISRGDELPHGVLKIIRVFIAQKRKISVGDKVAGRHGNKGVIAKVMPVEDMPFLADGTPVDMVLNPLGVPSRMNVGQILECALGWACKVGGFQAISPVFEGATIEEIKEELKRCGLPEDGKTILYDGRTGEPFDYPIAVGYMYMLKLIHLADDKIHARSTGPYSLITQQPLGGKAQLGGQRLGEMEVWALEAYGASHTLQEMLTVKSDDVDGRAELYEAMIRGENPPRPRVPASFTVMLKELQGLGFDVILGKEKK